MMPDARPARRGAPVGCGLILLFVAVAAQPLSAQTTVFSDNFETNKGWTVNPNGTDTATTGKWERGDPEGTSSGGTVMQLGTTASGVNALVTGRLAGSSAGTHDVDGGSTSVQSPAITLPPSGSLTLTLRYSFAHLGNATSDDFLRLTILGSTSTSSQRTGTGSVRAAAWNTWTMDLGAFAGQTIRIRLDAADGGTGSLIEAAVDDVLVTAGGGCPGPKSLSVRARTNEYTKSGVFVARGASVTLTASGTWTHPSGSFGPEGNPNQSQGKCQVGQLASRIGIYGNTQCLGASSTFTADADGHLMLWQWKASGGGSSGSLAVTISGGDSCSSVPPALPAPYLAAPSSFASTCNPPFTFVNEHPSGGALFLSEVPDPEAWWDDIARKVCARLYNTASQARFVRTMTLRIRDCPGVAAKSGDPDATVQICGPHLENLESQGRDVGYEVAGVMTHETVHVFQYNDRPDSSPPSWLIEGIADAARLKSDLISPDSLATGGSYTSSYKTTAYFLVWLETRYPDFLYRINQSLKPDGSPWTTGAFQTITGKSVDTLWSEYQAFLQGKV